MKVVILLVTILSMLNAQSTQCQKYVQKLIQDLEKFNLADLPLPSIMYSGITTNNPGQMEECQQANNSHYSYYLVNIRKDETDTFTGLCVPEQCSAEDIQIIASEIVHCKVYQYPDPPEIDYLGYLGLIMISLWVAVLFVWSCVISFKEPVINEYIKKDQERGSINVDEPDPENEDESEEKQENYKIFNYYEGYVKIFKYPSKKSIFSPIFALAILSYAISVEFSYKQTIAENQNNTASELLDSAAGVFVCNTEIALETIIFILGLRLAYGTYKAKTLKEIGRYFFDQILIKWLNLILMTLLIYTVMTVFVSDPLSKVWDLKYGQDCPNYLWQTWFLIRNVQLDCKLCLPWVSLFATEILFTIISIPFLLIFKSNKKLGYGLFGLLILTSIVISFAILDSDNIVYEPTVLMNGQAEFVIDYQANSFVRMDGFFLGLMLGLLVIEGLQKDREEKTKEYQLAKSIKRNASTQNILQLVGLALMITGYLLIIPFLGQKTYETSAYVYLTFVPLMFILGLALFSIPSFWEGESKLTVLINRVLGWRTWVHFDKIGVTYYLLAPMVIGFTTYSMQSSIYYDYLTVMTYLLGDLCLAYILSLVCTAAFENQLIPIISWLQVKIFGNETKYSVLVIEQ